MKSVFHLFCATAALVAVLAAGGCSKQGGPEGNPGGPGRPGGGPGGGRFGEAPKVPEAVPVEVETARIGAISAFLSFNSSIEVETAVDIYPETAGQVQKLLVEEGDRVKAGQPLLELEHDEQAVELRESEVNLAMLESNFRRTQEVYDRGLINQQDFETRKFELEQARLRLERARISIERATVKAPVNGVITTRTVQPGARVSASTKVFSLMSLDDMIARVFVPGRYLTTVTEGQEARLTSEFLPGRQFDGWVKRISPVVDPASGTFKVTVGVKPAAEPPPPGLFVNVRVITDRKNDALLVPKRAVVYEGGERFIFLVRDGKAEKLRLDAGYEEGDAVEVRSSVAAGDAVVVLGQNALKDQAAVRIVDLNAPAAAANDEKPAKRDPAGT